MNFHTGIDIFFSDPDEPVVEHACLACGSKMEVERRKTYRSYAGAMAQNLIDSYVHTCPFVNDSNHLEIIRCYLEFVNNISSKWRWPYTQKSKENAHFALQQATAKFWLYKKCENK